jgi:hypothetical protein
MANFGASVARSRATSILLSPGPAARHAGRIRVMQLEKLHVALISTVSENAKLCKSTSASALFLRFWRPRWKVLRPSRPSEAWDPAAVLRSRMIRRKRLSGTRLSMGTTTVLLARRPAIADVMAVSPLRTGFISSKYLWKL